MDNLNNLIQQARQQRDFWRQETQRLITVGADPQVVPVAAFGLIPNPHPPLVRQLQRLLGQITHWRQAVQLLRLNLNNPPVVNPALLVNMANVPVYMN